MKKIIVTADDYGMSNAVNRAIDAGVEIGLITSTNIMTNMDYYREAAKLKGLKNLSLGIHFTLSAGRPVCEVNEVPTLVGNDGCFHNVKKFKKLYRKGEISSAEIVKELKAQYKRYEELLGKPDYWNTHQNVHVGFKIYKLFVDTACELGIEKMRSHQRIYVAPSVNANKRSFVWRITEPIKSKLLNYWQKNANKKGISSPDGILVALNREDSKKTEYFFSHINWKDNDIGEFVIHPATEKDSPYFGNMVETRIEEYKLFSSLDTKKIIESAGLELSSFVFVPKGDN